MFSRLAQWFSFLFYSKEAAPESMAAEHKDFLAKSVSFYSRLNNQEKAHFELCCLAFIHATEFVGHNVEVSDHDKLLIASGSVILAWGFDKWHYVKVDTVYLVDGAFNDQSEFGAHDSNITGLVGTHHLRGKMILSQPALHQGFSNDKDKRNVAIHEFAHLIDIADGDVDGLPRELSAPREMSLPAQLKQNGLALPWLELVNQEIAKIRNKQSSIRDYGGTNNAEFFAVSCEYFFERPKLLKLKHPDVYSALQRFYQQNLAEVQRIERVRKKAPCPCGSGKRYKRCCLARAA